MIELLITIFFGALAGWLASIIMNTNSQQGFILDVVVGIVGSFVGKWAFGMLGFSFALGPAWVYSLIVAVVGACILLLVVKLLTSLFSRR